MIAPKRHSPIHTPTYIYYLLYHASAFLHVRDVDKRVGHGFCDWCDIAFRRSTPLSISQSFSISPKNSMAPSTPRKAHEVDFIVVLPAFNAQMGLGFPWYNGGQLFLKQESCHVVHRLRRCEGALLH